MPMSTKIQRVEGKDGGASSVSVNEKPGETNYFYCRGAADAALVVAQTHVPLGASRRTTRVHQQKHNPFLWRRGHNINRGSNATASKRKNGRPRGGNFSFDSLVHARCAFTKYRRVLHPAQLAGAVNTRAWQHMLSPSTCCQSIRARTHT